jgi:prevent-host-death family protein
MHGDGWRVQQVESLTVGTGLLKDYIWTLEGSVMRYSTQVRPISFLKANAAEVMHQLGQQREPMVITQNGTAKAVIQDVASWEATQETLALLKILALGNRQVEQGKVEPLARVVERLRARRDRG